MRRTPSLAQSTAPELLQQDLGLMGGVNGARLFPGHDAHSGFGMCSQHWEPSLLQRNSSSQGKQQCIYSGPGPALPQVSDGGLLWLPGVIFGLTGQFVIPKLS